MKIDPSKLARQEVIIRKWWGVNAVGVVEAVTGFGKTYTVLMMIQRMLAKFPSYRTTVIVPALPLKDAWEKQITSMGLANVTVYVVNTYVKFIEGDPRLECELLAADEVHHYCSEDAQFFNKVLPITRKRYFIGVSATLEKEEIAFLKKCGVPLFDSVTQEEAELNGWIAPSTVYNLGLTLTEADKKYTAKLNEQFNKNFAKFGHNLKLMMACCGGNKAKVKVQLNEQITGWKTGKEWREIWAFENEWLPGMSKAHPWSPDMLLINAITGTKAMRERKSFLYSVPSKTEMVLELIEFFKGKKIIVFCESNATADEIEALLPHKARAYHSSLSTIIVNGKKVGAAKRRKKIVEEFEDPNSGINVIVCVKALDEGFNVESIEVGIQHSYTSKKRRDVQRRGRSGRIDYNNLSKKAILINLYMKGSHEVKWLTSKQKNAKKPIWIDSIDQIKLEDNNLALI